MRRLISSAFAAAVAVFARRAVVVALVVLTALFAVEGAQAATPLRRPLSFLPAASVLVVTPGAANVVERVMRVSPYLSPQADTLTAHSARAFCRLATRQPDLARCSADTLARLFLVTGEAHIAAALDRERLRRDSLLSANPTDRAAAQALLNTLGWVAASEGTDLYVNLPVDCMINVATPASPVSLHTAVRCAFTCDCPPALSPIRCFSTAAACSLRRSSADISWWIVRGVTMRNSITICPSENNCLASEARLCCWALVHFRTRKSRQRPRFVCPCRLKSVISQRIFKTTYGNYR